MKKDLYLMRHGQTVFNERKRIQGWVDSPLTELGKQQAVRTKERYLHDVVFDAAYSSTSERACDTLELVCDLPYVRLKGLKEMNFGKLDGEPEYLNPPLEEYDTYFKKLDGESRQDVADRMTRTLTEVMNGPGTCVLAVTHGGALANFYKKWEGHSPVRRKGKIRNCACFHYVFDTETQEFVLQDYFNEP